MLVVRMWCWIKALSCSWWLSLFSSPGLLDNVLILYGDIRSRSVLALLKNSSLRMTDVKLKSITGLSVRVLQRHTVPPLPQRCVEGWVGGVRDTFLGTMVCPKANTTSYSLYCFGQWLDSKQSRLFVCLFVCLFVYLFVCISKNVVIYTDFLISL